MPILKSTRPLDWPALALELLLIFVGITAALWFDGVKEARQARETETQVLVDLSRSLARDTADLNQNLRASARTLASIDTILARFDDGRPYDDVLAAHFSRAAVFTGFLHNPGVYEYLKSIGLGTLADHDLRAAVARYFEYTVPYLREVEQLFVEGNWTGAVRPQMMEKFDYRFLFEPAVPHDFEALRADREYRTMLRTTREVIGWKDARSRLVRTEAEELLARVDRELAARSD